MPKIFLKFNERVLKEIPLDKPRFTIGRKPDNDLVIDNPVVSGHHALIVSEEGAFFIEDLGSTNGTFVNDAKIQKEKLKNSDCIVVGKHVLIDLAEIALRPRHPLVIHPRAKRVLHTARPHDAVETPHGTLKRDAV